MSKDNVQEKINKLSMLEQNLSNMLMQKQQIQSQLVEAETALKELENAKTAFRIIGNIMVDSDPKSLKEDLENKKEMYDLRLSSIDKQEKKMREEAQSLQQEMLKEMGGGKNESA